MFHMYLFEKSFDKLFWYFWNVIVHKYFIIFVIFCMIVQHLWFWVISNLWRTSDMGRLTLPGNNFAKLRETSNCGRYHCSEELNIYYRRASSTCYHIVFEWNHPAKEVKSPAHSSIIRYESTLIFVLRSCLLTNAVVAITGFCYLQPQNIMTQPMISPKPGKIGQIHLNSPF